MKPLKIFWKAWPSVPIQSRTSSMFNTLNGGQRANAKHFTVQPGRANAPAQSHHLPLRREPGLLPGATARSASSNGRPLRVGREAGSNPDSASCRSNPPPLLHVQTHECAHRCVRTDAREQCVRLSRNRAIGEGLFGGNTDEGSERPVTSRFVIWSKRLFCRMVHFWTRRLATPYS
jgi:hypothetical protein